MGKQHARYLSSSPHYIDPKDMRHKYLAPDTSRTTPGPSKTTPDPSNPILDNSTKCFSRSASWKAKCLRPVFNAKDWLIESVNDAYEQFAYFVFDHTWQFIFWPIILCLILSLGFLFRQSELDMDILYSLPVSPSTENGALLQSVYCRQAKLQLSRTFELERICYIFAVSDDESGLIRPEIFQHLSEFWDKVQDLHVPSNISSSASLPSGDSVAVWLRKKSPDQLISGQPPWVSGQPPWVSGPPTTVRDDSEYITLEDVCMRDVFNSCKTINPLDLYTTKGQWGSPIRVFNYPNFFNLRSRKVFRIDAMLGGLSLETYPERVVVNNCTALGYRIELRGSPQVFKRAAAWEQGLLTLVEHYKLPGVSFFIRTERSVSDELYLSSQLKGQDLLMLLTSCLSVMIYTIIVTSSSHKARSKGLASFVGIGITALAYGGGVGLWHLLGMKHVPPAEATPFIILGICLDDVFVLINAYSLTYMYSHDARKRIGISIRDAGVSITITTLTNVVAFGVGATSPYFAIFVFCILTASGLLAGYLLTLTVFLGALSLSARYEQKLIGFANLWEDPNSCYSGTIIHSQAPAPHNMSDSANIENLSPRQQSNVEQRAPELQPAEDETNTMVDIHDDSNSQELEWRRAEVYRMFSDVTPTSRQLDIYDNMPRSESQPAPMDGNWTTSLPRCLFQPVTTTMSDIRNPWTPAPITRIFSQPGVLDSHIAAPVRRTESLMMYSVPPESPSAGGQQANTRAIRSESQPGGFLLRRHRAPAPLPLSQVYSGTCPLSSDLSDYNKPELSQDGTERRNEDLPRPMFRPQHVAENLTELVQFRRPAAAAAAPTQTSPSPLACFPDGLYSVEELDNYLVVAERVAMSYRGKSSKQHNSNDDDSDDDNSAATTIPFPYTNDDSFNMDLIPRLIRTEMKQLIPLEKLCLAEPKGNVGVWPRMMFMKYYGPFLMNRMVKIVVLLGFAVGTIAALVNSFNLETGLELKEITPHHSYLRNFLDVREKWFSVYGDECILFFPTPGDWWKDNVQIGLIELDQRIQSTGDIVFITNGFIRFIQQLRESGRANSGRELFMQDFLSWLKTPEGLILSPMFTIKSGELTAWKLYYWTKFQHNSHVAMENLQAVRSHLEHAKIHGVPPGYAYTPLAIHWESDMRILSSAILNMAVAVSAMGVVASVLIPDFKSGMMILIVIIMIDVWVVGTMPLFNLKLNMMTVVNLVLAIGFAVDYTAHITHCFTHCKGRTRNNRAIETLVLMGLPVTNGMISTYGAVAALALSNKYVMIVVFQMMTIVLSWAFIHGVVLMPVVLSFFGPLNPRVVEVLRISNGHMTEMWTVNVLTGRPIKYLKIHVKEHRKEIETILSLPSQ